MRTLRHKGLACFYVTVLVLLAGCDQPAPPVDRSVSVMMDEETDTFTPVEPGRTFTFPQDHLPHPDFRNEWWYFTSNLKAESGEVFGVQWTLFRHASANRTGKGWQSPQRYMAHVVVTGEKKTWAFERFARGGVGQAGVIGHPFRAWMDNWYWRSYGDNPFPGVLSFDDDGVKAKLAVQQNGSYILQGDDGYSKKHPTLDIASYYYSAPFLKVKGRLELDGKTYHVTGDGWYDREWSSKGLSSTQLGWDWFSMRLDDGSALMLYQIREKNKRPYYFGSRSWPDGRTEPLLSEQIRLSPVSFTTHNGKNYPLSWYIEVPSHQIKLKVDVVRKEQWLPFVFSYWEGPIRITGSHTGQGFMELTGY
ncbi:carotenoid 1,2-hydratase [Photobacterium japonica]